jgi:(p)ppGpp synthase/HD superfamily hydrolase
MHYTKSLDEELQCIAVLHDVVEDSNVTWWDLREQGMSERVILAVRALTKIPGQSYDEYREAIFANRDAMLVKLADLRHNCDIRRLKGVTVKDRERMARYHEFAFDIQQRIHNA